MLMPLPELKGDAVDATILCTLTDAVTQTQHHNMNTFVGMVKSTLLPTLQHQCCYRVSNGVSIMVLAMVLGY